MAIGKPMLNKHRPAGQRGEALVAKYRARRAGMAEEGGLQNRSGIVAAIQKFRPKMAAKLFSRKKSGLKSAVAVKPLGETAGENNGFAGNPPPLLIQGLQAPAAGFRTGYAKRIRASGAFNTEEGRAAGGTFMSALQSVGGNPFTPIQPSVDQQRVSGAVKPPGAYNNLLGLSGYPLMTDTRGLQGSPGNQTRFY